MTMTTEEKTEAVEREPREWQLVPPKETTLTALAFSDRSLAIEVAEAMGVASIHVREVLEKTDE